MCSLAREISCLVADDAGPDGLLRRLSDPFWFQAFGCALGFDWHSSGVTTTVCGALKEGLKDAGKDLGIYVAGGKGRAGNRTPSDIESHCEQLGRAAAPLVYASRMSAKVDSAAVQDGCSIYHHSFFFTSYGRWAVVQQGMNPETRYARRYHWLAEGLADFVNEPHAAVCADAVGQETLNWVAGESAGAREAASDAARESPDRWVHELAGVKSLHLPARHDVRLSDIAGGKIRKILLSTYERAPEDFETLLGLPGVGPKTLRALSLIAELVYGEETSIRDPARFSFAHGGKDGHPYPVDRETYDRTVATLEDWIDRSRVDRTEKVKALKRLAGFGRRAQSGARQRKKDEGSGRAGLAP
jgi:hypothetical protein